MYTRTCSESNICEFAPPENSRCPYLPPVTDSGLRKCGAERDCERGFTCCYNIAGEGYCHKPTEKEMMKTN